MDDPIRAHLDGELDADQEVAFRVWLAADPARLAALLRASRFDQDLRASAAARVARDRPSLRRPAVKRRRQRTTPPVRWLWPVAAMLAVGCAAGGWLLIRPSPAPPTIARQPQHPQPAPTPTPADPIVVAASPDTRIDDRPAVAGQGGWRTVRAGAGATVGWRDGTRLRLAPGATLTLDPEPGAGVRLDAGSIAAVVPAHATMRVATVHGIARFAGGEASLSVAATGTDVAVGAGSAELEDVQGRRLRLDRGASAMLSSVAAPVRLPGWSYAVDLAADPAAAVRGGWDGILRGDGIEAVLRPTESTAAGTDVRWISSPRDLAGLARIGPGSRFRIACSVAEPCVVSFTLVVHDRITGQWIGNLQADLHPTPGAVASQEITWQDLRTLVGAAKEHLAGQVLVQATLVTGAGDHRLRLHSFTLTGGGL
jgi:ferric-dicitrate binding protein FerR (iron transport regulator)